MLAPLRNTNSLIETMKAITLFTLALGLSATAVNAGEFTGNVSGGFSRKSMDKEGWEDADGLNGAAVIADFKQSDWYLSVALDAFLSAEKDDVESGGAIRDYEASSADIHLGVRKIWSTMNDRINPYIGGGVAWVQGSQERLIGGLEVDESDSAVGGWVGAGVYWRPVSKLNIGLDVRYSDANVTLFNQEVEVGGTMTNLVIGYHW